MSSRSGSSSAGYGRMSSGPRAARPGFKSRPPWARCAVWVIIALGSSFRHWGLGTVRRLPQGWCGDWISNTWRFLRTVPGTRCVLTITAPGVRLCPSGWFIPRPASEASRILVQALNSHDELLILRSPGSEQSTWEVLLPRPRFPVVATRVLRSPVHSPTLK